MRQMDCYTGTVADTPRIYSQQATRERAGVRIVPKGGWWSIEDDGRCYAAFRNEGDAEWVLRLCQRRKR